ncbi:hypothetical protein FDE58_24910 [Vibrio parahaemolyticus]|uniref:YceK/YidQ family lipoprotein n=1 Tax=Vibrio parahaemolyticus TaxID=670 RepID=UPI00128EFAA9|nr:YceK/YidQ family lipoprotein [Vibrio parahaemolyticus]MQD84185.1 hypothetical protein [Vibrio parahaemolyticus]
MRDSNGKANSLIDIPLSLATDVVFLPVDLIMVATPTTSYGGGVFLGGSRGTNVSNNIFLFTN